MNKFIKGLQKQLTKGMRESASVDKVEEVIKSYFDKKNWKYQMYTDENSIITFRLGVIGDYETVNIKISIDPEMNFYHIVGGSDISVAEKDRAKGIIAINNYNLSARVVSGCIGSDGSILFWMGRNVNGNAFSEEAFAIDLFMVINETDHQTAHIFKQASMDQN